MLKGLIEFRRTLGLSKAGMALMLNISLSYYEKIESGKRQPSYNFIKRFSIQFPYMDITTIFFIENRCESYGSVNPQSEE